LFYSLLSVCVGGFVVGFVCCMSLSVDMTNSSGLF
jgi:hypothetical protein